MLVTAHIFNDFARCHRECYVYKTLSISINLSIKCLDVDTSFVVIQYKYTGFSMKERYHHYQHSYLVILLFVFSDKLNSYAL